MEIRKCSYCGRVLEKKYDKCPSCGSKDFDIVRNPHAQVIENPPKKGYKIPRDTRFKIDLIMLTILIIFFIYMGTFLILDALSNFNDLGTGFSILFYSPFILVILFFIIIFIAGIVERLVKNKKVNHLEKTGILIKNLDYNITREGKQDVPVLRIYYEFLGKKLGLKSNPKTDGKISRKDGTVDLLIDPDDFKNYYIGIDIK